MNRIEKYRSYLILIADRQLDPRLRHKLDASDIVQTTMLEAHVELEKFSGTESGMVAWLTQILTRNLLDGVKQLRRQKRDAAREVSIDAAIDHSSMRLERVLAVESSDAFQKLDHAEEVVRLSEALLRLSVHQRTAVTLKHWHGWTVADIATEMNRSKTAVAGLIKRGLQNLRQSLTEQRPTPTQSRSSASPNFNQDSTE